MPPGPLGQHKNQKNQKHQGNPQREIRKIQEIPIFHMFHIPTDTVGPFVWLSQQKKHILFRSDGSEEACGRTTIRRMVSGPPSEAEFRCASF